MSSAEVISIPGLAKDVQNMIELESHLLSDKTKIKAITEMELIHGMLVALQMKLEDEIYHSSQK